jgi:GT2 family glycosyltransferase
MSICSIGLRLNRLNKASSNPDALSSQESAEKTGKISVLIICSDRFEELIRGLASLEILGDLLLDVRVLKNAPSVEWKKDRLDSLPAAVREKCVIFPAEQRVYPTEGRNRLAEGSKADAFLFLDDDSYLLEPEGIRKGFEILQRDKSAGSVAYPQCDEKGAIIGNFAQPAPVDYPCLTCGFMTCGALVRADVYRKLGGFQEILQMAHEENEFCRRQWNLGYSVIYLPTPTVCHNPSEGGRNMRQRAKLNTRNVWYMAVLHEPLWLLCFSLPRRIWAGRSYLKWVKHWTGGEWQSLYREGLKEFFRDFGELVRRRSPLKLSTLQKWQRIKKTYPRYTAENV